MSDNSERVQCVAGYARVSTIDQGKRWSMPMQKESILGYCRARGLPDPERIYEDDESGKSVEREEFDLLLDAVRAGKYTHVVFLRIDRLARNLRGIMQIHDDVFRKTGTALACIELGVDTSTITGRYVFQIMAATAEYDGAQITDRTKVGKHRQRKERGTWWGGTPPYGYRQGAKPGLIDPVPEEAEVVRLIFERRASGVGVDSIARELDTLKRKTRHGKPWHRQTILAILDREDFYRGLRTINRNADDDGVVPAHRPLLGVA